MDNKNLILGLGLGALVTYLLIKKNDTVIVKSEPKQEPETVVAEERVIYEPSWWGNRLNQFVYPTYFGYGYPLIQVTNTSTSSITPEVLDRPVTPLPEIPEPVPTPTPTPTPTPEAVGGGAVVAAFSGVMNYSAPNIFGVPKNIKNFY